MESDLTSLVRKNSLYVLCGKAVTPVITFLITVYLVRRLSVSEYGIYNVMLASMMYIGLFSSLGLLHVFQRYIPEFRERRETSNLKTLVGQGLLWRLVLSGVIIVCVILFSDQIGKLLKIGAYIKYFQIFCLGILFCLESQLIGIALVSLFLHKYFVMAQIIYTLVRAGILYYLLERGWNLEGVLFGEVVAYGVLLALQVYWYKKGFSTLGLEETKDDHRPFPLRRLARFGGFSYFSEMGEQVLDTSTDFFIISAYLGPEMVGLYGFADRVMRFVYRLMPQRLLMDVIRPSVFTKHTQSNDPRELDRMFKFLTKFVAFFTFPLVAAILVLGDKLIVHVFDPKYLNSLGVLWVLAAFMGLNSFTFPIGLVVQSVERVEIDFYSKIFSVYNLIGDLLVVRPFGIVGVALVTSTAMLFRNLFNYFFVKKYVSFSFDLKSLSVIGINSLMMAGLLYLLRGLAVDIYSFFFVVVAGGIVYLFVAYLNKGFSEDERNVVNRILRRPIFVF